MTRRRVVVMALALMAAAPACGGSSSSSDQPSASPTSKASTSSPTTAGGAARPGMPTVPTADDRTIPRASTREAVIEGRPAVVVTLPEAVLFDFGKAVLRADAEPSLRAVVDLVGDNPGARTEVQGHTDSVGSAAANQSLSERRAEAVSVWLSGHGVDPATLTKVGFGSARPVADNATAEGRQANRRVEVVVYLA